MPHANIQKAPIIQCCQAAASKWNKGQLQQPPGLQQLQTGRIWVVISLLNVWVSSSAWTASFRRRSVVVNTFFIFFFFLGTVWLSWGHLCHRFGTEAAGFLPPTSLSQIRHPISERLMNSRLESRSDIDVLPLIIVLRLMSCSISCSRRAANSPPLFLILLILGRGMWIPCLNGRQMSSGRFCNVATVE